MFPHLIQQLLISIDQLFNVIVWIRDDGFGYADETLSARAWRLRKQSRAWRRINRLFFWQTNHCKDAYDSEWLRHQLPSEYRSRVRPG